MSELPRTRIKAEDAVDPETDDDFRNRLWYLCGDGDKYLTQEITHARGPQLDEIAERFNILRRLFRRIDGTVVT